VKIEVICSHKYWLHRELKAHALPARFLASLKTSHLFLRYPNEDHPFSMLELSTITSRDIIFALPLLKADNRNAYAFGKRFNLSRKRLGDVTQHGGRGNHLAAMMFQKVH
jgi:hypothetical protein